MGAGDDAHKVIARLRAGGGASGASARKPAAAFIVTGCALVAVMFASFFIGRYQMTPGEVIGVLVSRFVPVAQTWGQMTQNIVEGVRLPRILMAVLIGAALSVSGASYQCIFRNPMAAPDVLGASTGAAFGAALAILSGMRSDVIMLSAFVAGLACIALVFLCSKVGKGDAVLSLVLSGIVVGALFQAGTSYLKLIADPHNTLPEITYWLMGSLSGASQDDLARIVVPLALGFVSIFVLRWRMNLLTLDDAEARSLGVNTRATRAVVIVSSTLLTAASVSASGVIGWIGLVVPHAARKLVGNDCRSLIPLSAVLGGLFLLAVDNVARTLYTIELPLGILTALVGAPFFIYLMSRRMR